MAAIAEKRSKQAKNKGKNNKQGLVSNNFIEKFRLVLMVILGIVIFYPPFLRGLYFEEEQLPTEIFVFIIYLAFLIYKYIKQDKKFIKTPIEYVSFGFVLVYLLSIFASVGTREAIGEWLKYCMFFAVFIMLSELLNTYKSKIAMLWVLVASALGVSIIGIDGIAGEKLSVQLNNIVRALGSYKDIFFGTFVGNRINSTFQYPNATAAYLMAVFFVAVTLMMLSKRLYSRLIAVASAYVVLITFMLTLSRGAVVFLPVVGLLFILMQSKGNRIRSVVNMLPAGAAMLATLTKLSNIMANPKGIEASVWKYFALGIFIAFVVQCALELVNLILKRIKANNEGVYNKLRVCGYVLCGVAVVAIIAASIAAVTLKAPLVLSHENGQADSDKSVRRSYTLEPDKDYKLVYNVTAENEKNKPNSYSIKIASRNFSGVINGVDEAITTVEGKATSGIEQREIQFKVPSNSKAVSITFANFYEGTKAEFKDARIVPVAAGGKEEKIALKYKFIPESIYARIDEAKETKSGIERTIFAKDGLEIFKDHPILGGGGGSWPLQYFAHQSYLYWTTQAHNYPIQVAVETGILGIIVLLALWATVGFQIIEILRKGRSDRGELGILNAGVMAGCLALIMHSCMDFDLSLSSIYLVLWELLAIINSNIIDEDVHEDNKTLQKFIYGGKTIMVNPILTGIIALVIIVFPVMFNGGLGNSTKAVINQNQNNATAALNNLSSAISWDSISPKYKADYINFLVRQFGDKLTKNDIVKTNKYAESIEKDGEHDIDIAGKLASYYMGIGNEEKGKHFLDKAIQLGPLRPEVWEQKAVWYYQMALYYTGTGNTAGRDKYLNDILQISNNVKKASQKSMIPFVMSPSTMETIEKVTLLQDKQNSASQSISARSAFYSIDNIDVDNNGIPDEWNDTNTNDLKLQVEGNKLTAEAQNGKQGVLQSRKIVLQPGKQYVISVELENYQNIKEIPVTLSGMKDQLKLVRDGANYTTEFNTQAGAKIDPVSLGIVVNGKYVIKDVRVVEK